MLNGDWKFSFGWLSLILVISGISGVWGSQGGSMLRRFLNTAVYSFMGYSHKFLVGAGGGLTSRGVRIPPLVPHAILDIINF